MANEISTFRELKQLIDQAISEGKEEVTLEKDYKYVSTDEDLREGIEISGATLKINGNNHTIDGGEDAARAFKLLESIIQIQNLSFNKTRGYDIAGHILSQDSNLTLSNCTFKKGQTSTYGGSICVNGGYLNIVNCYFEGNKCLNAIDGGEGGSIFSNDGPLSVVESDFESCQGELGGAISVRKRAFLNNCNFNKNKAPQCLLGSKGGAIWSKDNLYIDNCVFKENSGEKAGGAIASERPVYLKNSRLFKNTCEDIGGAVYSEVFVESDSCSFIQNSSEGKGGAIHSPNTRTTKSKFIENSSGGYAKAIFLDGGSMYCQQNSFDRNISSSGDIIHGDADEDFILIRGNWWGRPNPDWDKGLIVINGENMRDEDPAPSPI